MILQGGIVDIPYIVIDQLVPDQQQVWKTYFGDADRPRYIADPVLVDLRNLIDADAWRMAGWTVRQLGRPAQE
ncbi:hypothetical protein ACPXCE_29285 [Streptomyces sp. DT24]|uniref:hypothetical protein n=1 Tax=Streptomyces sp. DT24 TaxID=3416520 RepID=UPI003CF02AEF